jgi:type II secretory pathway pseudopilin PulG
MRACRQSGFTLVALLITVAIMGAGFAALGELASHAAQREREQQLLFVGQQYRQAIGAYYQRTPGMVKHYPKTLEDLLADNRYPGTQRYLRRLYPDPMTGSIDWGLMEAPGGGIMGVYSKAGATPLKTGGFSFRDANLAYAASYTDWKFYYDPFDSPNGLRSAR